MNAEMKNEMGLLALAEVSMKDLEENYKTIQKGKSFNSPPTVVTWLLPPVTHALKGGVRTVFMLAENFSKKWGTLNNFVMYSYSGKDIPTLPLSESLSKYFPQLNYTVIVFKNKIDDISYIPTSDISFCTLWTTAYLQVRYNNTRKKFYLMQDYEPIFYSAGSIYGAIEQTYRFGFSCISNTSGVGNKYLTYSSDVTFFSPGVDTETFYPEQSRNDVNEVPRVVFYGRPSNPRDCFALGIKILTALKRKFGNSIEIISVGENYDVKDYGLENILTNRGLLGSMEEVAELYRSSDLGLVFMMTPHPSYQPLEYMASGCVTVTNINESNVWLLNNDNSLLVEPIPEIAAQRMHDILKDKEAWQSKRTSGLSSISSLKWKNVFEIVNERVVI